MNKLINFFLIMLFAASNMYSMEKEILSRSVTRKKRKRTGSEEVSSAKRIKGALSPEQFKKELQRLQTAEQLPEKARQSLEIKDTQKIIAQNMIKSVINYLKKQGPYIDSRYLSYNQENTSHDGKRFIIADEDRKKIEVWNIYPFKLHFKLHYSTNIQFENVITHMLFSPDDKKIAIGFNNGNIQILDLISNKLIYNFTEHIDQENEEEINDIQFTPDNTCLVASFIDGTLRIWDLQKGEQLFLLGESNNNAIKGFTISPDSTKIAALFSNKKTLIWSLKTGKLLYNFNGNITSRSFSFDSTKLAIKTLNDVIQIWNVVTGKLLYTLKSHMERISLLSFSPDGKKLAIGSQNQSVQIFDANTGKLLHSLNHNKPLIGLIFSKDSSKVITTSKKSDTNNIIQIWNVKNGKEIDIFDKLNDVDTMILSRDYSEVIIISHKLKQMQVWDIATGKQYLSSFDLKFQGIESIQFDSTQNTAVFFTESDYVYVWYNLHNYIKSLQWLQNKLPGQKQFLLPDQAQIIIDMYRSHKAETQMDLFICTRDLSLNQVNILIYMHNLYVQQNKLNLSAKKQTLSMQQMEEIFNWYIYFRTRGSELSQKEEPLSLDDAIQLLKMYQSYLKVKKELSQEDISRYLRLPKYVRQLLEYYLLRPLVEKKEKPIIAIPLR